jgi:hypothetical protein
VTVFGATGFLGRYIVNRLGTQHYKGIWEHWLILENSQTRMHCYRALPGGDGEASLEGFWRSRPGHIHGMGAFEHGRKSG